MHREVASPGSAPTGPRRPGPGRNALRLAALSLAVALASASCRACDDGDDAGRLCEPAGSGAVLLPGALGISGTLATGDSPEAVAARAEAFQLLADAGLGSLRQLFLWSEIEPAPGAFAFDAYDALVDDALVRGVEVVGVLAFGTPWAISGMDLAARPVDLDDYARFAGATAGHFAGRVAAWEMWHEPNVAFFWASAPEGEPAVYAEMVARAAEAIRETGTDALVVLGGTIFHEQPFVALGGVEFLELAFAAWPTLGLSVDAVAVHPYPLYPVETAPEASGGGEVPLAEQIARVRAVLEVNAAGARPIWVTEIGWPTFGPVSDSVQARYVVRGVLLALGAGAARVELHTLTDLEEGTGRDPPLEHFGLWALDADPGFGLPPAPKPVVAALARVGAVLAGTRAVCAAVPLAGADDGGIAVALHALRFESPDGSRRVTAIWQEVADAEARAQALLPMAGATAARVVLPDGEERLLDPAGPVYVVFPSPDPLYVIETIAAGP